MCSAIKMQSIVLVYVDCLLYIVGRNDAGQLGHGDTERRDIPTLIESLSDFNIVNAACGKSHTLFLTGLIACH